MVYTKDLKSFGLTALRVQVPPEVPQKQRKALSVDSGGAFFASGVQKRKESTPVDEFLLLSLTNYASDIFADLTAMKLILSICYF
jgi:hypothetical protein